VNATRLEASPRSEPARADAARDAAELCDFVDRHAWLFVLSGAGVSTDSGIPGYRDAEGRWQRPPPVLAQDFLRSEAVRRRYWARSMVGWPIVAGAHPNGAHRALARLEAAGKLRQLVTQNVDGLHQRAGSVRLIELHGNIGEVICRGCGAEYSRAAIQDTLEAENPSHAGATGPAAADGDAARELGDFADFRVPACAQCAGVLKPAVVFFGESVPQSRVALALQSLAQADALLVVGSSLMVYSGYRFCVQAAAMGKPIAALNIGRTRADHLLALKVEQPCAEILSGVVQTLGHPLHSTVIGVPDRTRS
jgi:NAD-dependent SIR2 family protein deacetylase